jgi:uncharacterized protein
MTRKVLYLLILIVIIAIAWYTLSVLNIEGSYDEKLTRLNLNYQAVEEFKPDLAIILLGVETTGSNLNEAFAENNSKMGLITEELKMIENLTLETLNFQVNPIYNEENDKDKYLVLNQLKATTENLDDLGIIIEKAISTGANQVLSINYSLENREKARQEVTRQAIEGIKEKAAFMVQELGMEGYRIISMDVNDHFQERNLFQLKAEGAGYINDTPLPPISPHKIQVNVNINAGFSLY